MDKPTGTCGAPDCARLCRERGNVAENLCEDCAHALMHELHHAMHDILVADRVMADARQFGLIPKPDDREKTLALFGARVLELLRFHQERGMDYRASAAMGIGALREARALALAPESVDS